MTFHELWFPVGVTEKIFQGKILVSEHAPFIQIKSIVNCTNLSSFHIH